MRKIVALYTLTVISSLVVIAEMTIPQFGEIFSGSLFFLLPFAVLFLFSLLTLITTLTSKIEGALRTFLLITGGAGAAIFVSIVLHNIVYGIFVHLFGEGIWGGLGGDEPVLFILGLIVFPILYLIGAIGTTANFLIRQRR